MTAYQPVNLMAFPLDSGAGVNAYQTVPFGTTDLVLGDFSIYRARFLKVDNYTDAEAKIELANPDPNGMNADDGSFSAIDLTQVNLPTLFVPSGESILLELDPGSSKGVRAVYTDDDPQNTPADVPGTLEPNLNLLGQILRVTTVGTIGNLYISPVAISG